MKSLFKRTPKLADSSSPKTNAEYNQKLREQLLRSIDLLKSDVLTLVDGCQQFHDGYYVFEKHLGGCIFFLNHIHKSLTDNYTADHKCKCGYCEQTFEGYFAGERSRTHEVENHQKEIMERVSVIITAMTDSLMDDLQEINTTRSH